MTEPGSDQAKTVSDSSTADDQTNVQIVRASTGSTVQNVIQAGSLHIHIDADVQRLKLELTSANEHRWQEHYERLRSDVNAGYADIVRELIIQLIAEIEAYEAQAPVNTDLKARFYRLAAIVHLPYQTGGNADICARFLEQARAFSTGDGLIQCQIAQALLLYECGDAQKALGILDSLSTEEAIRLRFAIYLETSRIDECRQMIESGRVNPAWTQTKADWARVFLGYFSATGRRQEAEDALGSLIAQAPTPDNYRVAAQSLARLAYARLNEFCQTHSVFLEFHIGLDLDELIDAHLPNRSAHLFVESARLYEQRGCTRDAISALTAAIRLSMDDGPKENLTSWISRLAALEPQHPLLVGLRQSGMLPQSPMGTTTILDLAPLVG